MTSSRVSEFAFCLPVGAGDSGHREGSIGAAACLEDKLLHARTRTAQHQVEIMDDLHCPLQSIRVLDADGSRPVRAG